MVCGRKCDDARLCNTSKHCLTPKHDVEKLQRKRKETSAALDERKGKKERDGLVVEVVVGSRLKREGAWDCRAELGRGVETVSWLQPRRITDICYDDGNERNNFNYSLHAHGALGEKIKVSQ